jgi:serine/threonine-protein kinase HipA
VLLLDRFDRQADHRIAYMSAMTLFSARDGDSHDYIEVAEAIPEVSAATTADLIVQWRRIAFSVMVNNTDDHLRNHGFLQQPGGWALSPAFDINPNPDTSTSRQTGVGGTYRREDALDALLDGAGMFELTRAEADQALEEASDAVSGWRGAAERNGVDPLELDLFADAFWVPA